ncbi:MAG: DUF58 domain-containing protein [Verrucomicrobia bacterium]|nr:MAG: DUF58 domain-containing protein [Verrucomicrobiota bacterium]
MLVPRTRLILWITLIVLPFAAIAATLPTLSWLAATFIGGLGFLVIYDALVARSGLRGVRVILPEVVRLQKDRPGTIELRIQNDAQRARRLRLGFAFPREIRPESDDREALLPAGAEFSLLDWAVTPARRGQYFLDRVYLEAVSPLGFWAARTSHALRSELRVYPNLFDERKNVAAIFLKRGHLGAHAQRAAGQGRDFEKLRMYVPGDSLNEIHWKASAKRGHPVTKVFQVERTQEVYVIVDASRLSARQISGSKSAAPSPQPATRDQKQETPETTVLERYVTAALILGLAAEQQGDQFGLVTFSDRVLSFVRAKSGQAHYDACRDRLYALQPQSVTPDFEELCSFIRLRLRKRALLIFLTALDDPMLAESFAKASELISRQHLMIVDMLQPPGAQPLFSDAAVTSIDDLYRHLGGHLQWNSLRELEKVLKRRGVRFALLDSGKLVAQVIGQHAEVKRRQLL